MGKARNNALRLNLDRQLKLEFHGTKVTSGASLLVYRELDEAFGLTRTAGLDNIHPSKLVVFSRGACYDVNRWFLVSCGLFL